MAYRRTFSHLLDVAASASQCRLYSQYIAWDSLYWQFYRQNKTSYKVLYAIITLGSWLAEIVPPVAASPAYAASLLTAPRLPVSPSSEANKSPTLTLRA